MTLKQHWNTEENCRIMWTRDKSTQSLHFHIAKVSYWMVSLIQIILEISLFWPNILISIVSGLGGDSCGVSVNDSASVFPKQPIRTQNWYWLTNQSTVFSHVTNQNQSMMHACCLTYWWSVTLDLDTNIPVWLNKTTDWSQQRW